MRWMGYLSGSAMRCASGAEHISPFLGVYTRSLIAFFYTYFKVSPPLRCAAKVMDGTGATCRRKYLRHFVAHTGLCAPQYYQ